MTPKRRPTTTKMGRAGARLRGWGADPSDLLRAGPKFDIGAFDRAATPGWDGTHEDADAFRAARGQLLSEMQERLFAGAKARGDTRSVLLVVQGLDTAGKGGIVRHVAGLMDPQGLMIRSFGVPTIEERSHHYLWRIEKALPAAGKVGIFDRSHYEDVLVVRVNKLAEVSWPDRFSEINEWERQLVEGGISIVKVALLISREEQGLRLMERLSRPDKHWKYNPGDVDTRERFDEYQEAYQDMLRGTSTEAAPWFVLPADKKWYARLAVSELLAQALAGMELSWPQASYDVENEKRRLAATMTAETVSAALEAATAGAAKEAAEAAAFEAKVGEVRRLEES